MVARHRQAHLPIGTGQRPALFRLASSSTISNASIASTDWQVEEGRYDGLRLAIPTGTGRQTPSNA